MVVSSAETQYAKRVSGGRPGSGSAPQAVSPATARACATGRGIERSCGVQALGGQQPRDEVAEDHGRAVGDEVGAARRAALGAEHQALDGVVEVRGRRAMAPAADPRPPPAADHRAQLRQQRRVALAPHEPRPDRRPRRRRARAPRPRPWSRSTARASRGAAAGARRSCTSGRRPGPRPRCRRAPAGAPRRGASPR